MKAKIIIMALWMATGSLSQLCAQEAPKKSSTIQKETTMSKSDIKELAKKHLDIWSERNAEKRSSAMTQVYSPDVEIVDPFFVIHGQSKLNDFINDLQGKYPGFAFGISRPIDSHNNVARLFWQFGPESNPNEITGQDIFVIENGKIKSLYVFIDGLPEEQTHN